MWRIIYSFLIISLLVSCASEDSKEETEPVVSTIEVVESTTEETTQKKKPKSPRRQASGMVKGGQIEIDYGSPYVKDRVIWGGLVPYDKLWRAGANETTAITFDSDVSIADQTVKAGTYALFILPREDKNWIIVLNEQWSEEEHDVWGTYNYSKEKDILRFAVPTVKGEDLVESMSFNIENDSIHFAWEYLSLSFTLD